MAENHHWSLLTDSSTKLLKTEFRTSKRKKKKKDSKAQENVHYLNNILDIL